MRRTTALGLIAAALALAPPQAPAQTTLIAALEAEVATLDPHFTTAYISRTFGYMVFDTLFGMKADGTITPQMVDRYETSPDGLTWTFTLRDGLLWHDGTPVTAADCVASIRRWGPRGAMGRLITNATANIEVVDAKTFRLTLKEPFGLVLDALGRPNTPGPFMIPERLARTPGDTRITEIVGSGPFVFRADLHRPGDQIVLERNRAYVPRSEPTDFLAGAKLVKIDRLVLRTLPDSTTAANALMAGEIDFMQYVPFDLLRVLERNRNVVVQGFDGMHTFQGYYRLNHAAKPFDDPEIRRVLWKLVDQTTVLTALGLPERFMRPDCRSFFMCGTPLETTAGSEVTQGASIAAAREALRRTKYAGETIVILQATDIDAPRVSSTVLADLLRQAGFNVDLQAMDWGTVLTRRARKDGWHAFGVHAFGFDLASPLTHFYIVNNCNDFAGWHCDERLTRLLAEFPRAQGLEAQRAVAARISEVAFEIVPAVMWGQLAQPAGYRSNLRNVIPSAIPIFWNVEK